MGSLALKHLLDSSLNFYNCMFSSINLTLICLCISIFHKWNKKMDSISMFDIFMPSGHRGSKKNLWQENVWAILDQIFSRSHDGAHTKCPSDLQVIWSILSSLFCDFPLTFCGLYRGRTNHNGFITIDSVTLLFKI